ncbi:COP9 signalosome complex subunit 5 [Galdieria sulphuraria]|nr:COP9 signalosome complex subunit 5 [Galdieria sulphuraria]
MLPCSSSSATSSRQNEDYLYEYDELEQKSILDAKPWTKDPNYFRKVRISAIALLKMLNHAHSGVMDAFPLPVEGTETRVNAQAQGNEFLVDYHEKSKTVQRPEHVIGWYHSHPGYGCWLSGIDVSTQMTQQQYQDPFVAIVVDPIRTISSGKVDLGAFRTYPADYKPADSEAVEYQNIPLNKIEDFGVHCKRYYQLEVSYFKSSLDSSLLDLLWNKYWINNLSSSPLVTNREYISKQISDIGEKLEQIQTQVSSYYHGFGYKRQALT